MISDDDLHRLAIFLGSCAMMMIVLYHFLEVNAKDDEVDNTAAEKKSGSAATGPSAVPAAAAGGSSAIGVSAAK
ncbi:Oligosaccaryltransferase-domain-containing protein [Aspergillus avenaceus]|uniref:Dolichyl-diphosphooligosaccharide--protein glycosyltransferase subunit 4 n=1 Tax=Aspergillus avenaceus TaxID=36643 RepID=A0A5N6TNV1_ASPAV|nr:Oligosaccaryltransferase-domain-containing protein [Aspergillus avenaceus]